MQYTCRYSILQLKKNLPFEDVDGSPGLISYVLRGVHLIILLHLNENMIIWICKRSHIYIYIYLCLKDCDILVSASMTSSRFKSLDFTYPSTYLSIGYLIPKTKPTISLTSIFKPFSNEVS